MNEKEIDNLEGRELDLAIERYVFGNEKPKDESASWFQNDDGTWWSEQQDCLDGEWLRSWRIVQWPPEYHNSDYLAFKVVDKAIETYPAFSFNLHWFYDGWCAYASWCSEFEVNNQSRPFAICLAVLKVVMNDQKTD